VGLRNLRTRLRNGTVISILPNSALVRLPGGAIVRSRPQKTGAYRATAFRLGYGDDTLALCHQHDPLHAILCSWLGLPDSFALRCAAGLDNENELSAAEEAAVLAVQRFMRVAGVGLPT
jgi:hypothetical protein